MRSEALGQPISSYRRPRLEIRDLQVVLAVAGARSTAKAAETLHLSQSAVSRAILSAEDKLGARLFDRTVRGLAPTLAGQRLIDAAGPFLAQLADLESVVATSVEATVNVRLVCECYTAYRWLPSALAKLRPNLPRLEVTLAVEHTNAPVAALMSGEADIALLTTSTVRGRVREEPLFEDEIVFVVGTSHPLARETAITTADLRENVLITSATTPPAEAQWFYTRVFGRRIPKLKFLRFPLTEAIIDATRAGMGVAIMSEWIASGYLGGGDVVVKRLKTGPLLRPWRIAFRPELAIAAGRLAQALGGSTPRIYAQ
jgi:LysR family transcriptional regulator, regulator for metE and metH